MIYRYVYVIGMTDNPVKIGVADDPHERMMGLQIACPDKLILHHAVAAHSHLAEKVEKAAHQELMAHHRHGEWFNVTAAQALEAILRAAKKIGVPTIAEKTTQKGILKRASRHPDVPVGVMTCVKNYRNQRKWTGGAPHPLIARLEGRVLRDTDAKSLTVLRMAVSEPLRLETYFKDEPEAGRRAEAALVKALVSLCAFYEEDAEAYRADHARKMEIAR